MVTNTDMANKQTVVDWIVQRIIPSSTLPIKTINEFILQAKAMEKEQIKDAYLEASKQTCWSYGEEPPSDDNIYAEDYYNKTYANAE